MDDSFAMSSLEGIGDLPRDLNRRVRCHGTAAETPGQCRPVDELHHESVHTGRDLEAVNRRDVGMVQGGEQASFPLQARDALRIIGQRRRQHLDGNLPAQSHVEGSIHFAHPAGIQRRQNAVRSELEPRGHRRRWAVRHQEVVGIQRVDSGRVTNASRSCVCRKQRFDFVPELDVTATRDTQQLGAVIRRTRQRRVKDLLDPRPSTAFVSHGSCAARGDYRRLVPSIASSRNAVISACCRAAICISVRGPLSRRARSSASISSAVRPEARTMKMYPNLRS